MGGNLYITKRTHQKKQELTHIKQKTEQNTETNPPNPHDISIPIPSCAHEDMRETAHDSHPPPSNSQYRFYKQIVTNISFSGSIHNVHIVTNFIKELLNFMWTTEYLSFSLPCKAQHCGEVQTESDVHAMQPLSGCCEASPPLQHLFSHVREER